MLKVENHLIPLSKIFHTLNRKGFLKTIAWEKVNSPEYDAECDFYNKPRQPIDRLHFISASIDSFLDLRKHTNAYGGYCDLRPVTRTLIMAYISQDSVIRTMNETYAFLCCSMVHRIELRDEQGNVIIDNQVVTFPCCEKDKKTIMCSQAAILSLMQYWNYRKPGMFNEMSSVELNQKAGLQDEDVKLAVHGRGLTPEEIMRLFDSEKVKALPLIYDDTNKIQCSQDIYGFVESGIPVMAVLKMNSEHHAILCLGHTYDRNSWSAMAEIGYFKNYGAGKGNYHPNTTWIRNIIIHDDNFGPYYFLPTEKLQDLVVAGFVVLPDESISSKPTEAADAAFEVISSDPFLTTASELLSSSDYNENNKIWINEFIKHIQVSCGDGLVLRPLIIETSTIINRYAKHEFCEIINSLIGANRNKYYWFVEITWPDIYCHRQLCCGSVIIDPSTKMPIFTHIPGMCVVWEEAFHGIIAKNEDQPWKHYGESRY